MAKISGVDAMVFPRGSATDVSCGADVYLGSNLKRAAVVAEEVAGEAMADYGADLAAGSAVDAGDADEAGLHAGEMSDYYVHI